MHDGRIVQLGSPREFYERPGSEYVASFFGWKNFTPAGRAGDAVTCAFGTFELPGLGAATDTGLLVMRPEAAVNIGGGALEGVVRMATYRGASVSYRVECAGRKLELSLPASSEFSEGERFTFDLAPDKLWYVADDGDIAYSEDGRG